MKGLLKDLSDYDSGNGSAKRILKEQYLSESTRIMGNPSLFIDGV